MIAIKETPTGPMPEAVPAVIPVRELKFVTQRLALLQPQNDPKARQRAQDRTVFLVSKWRILTENLPLIKSQTLSCCEATEGKGGVVTLRIFDRPKYDAIQKSIKETSEQITQLEQAARELDYMHAGYLAEMRNTRDSLAGVETQQRAMLNTWAASALQRGANKRMSVEAILASDQLYQGTKTRVEFQIKTAKAGLDKLSPEIEKIEAILASVEC